MSTRGGPRANLFERLARAVRPLSLDDVRASAERMDALEAAAERSHRLVLALGIAPLAVEILLRFTTGMPFFSGVMFALVYARLADLAAAPRCSFRADMTAMKIWLAMNRDVSALTLDEAQASLPAINRSLRRGAILEAVAMPAAALVAAVALAAMHFSGAPQIAAAPPVMLLMVLAGSAGFVGGAHSRLVARLTRES